MRLACPPRVTFRSAVLGLGVLLLGAACASRPDARVARIDAYVRSEMSRRQIPGMSVLVLEDHEVVFEGHYGLADLAHAEPVTPRTSFEIASMTKAFTAAAVLLLAEQGRLSLDNRLTDHFAGLPETWSAMTVEQLANHTAGLRDDWDEDDAFFQSQTTNEEFFASLQAAPLKFSPGSDWSYGCGAFVLGLLVEQSSGEPYARFMRRALFEPLGMESTDVVTDPGAVSEGLEGLAAGECATGYVLRDGVLREGVQISPAAHARADVGIRSTARDLARWVAALDDASLLSDESRMRMVKPGRLVDGSPIAYGLGWFVTPFRGHTEISHGGGFRTGFNSVIARYPDDGLTVILLANRFGAGVPTMARAIAAESDDAYRPIASMSARPERDTSRTEVVARVMDALRSGSPCDALLPGVGRLGGWSRAEVREALAHASPPTFVDVQDLSGEDVRAFGTPIVANVFLRTDGDRRRSWTASFTADLRVAYLELED